MTTTMVATTTAEEKKKFNNEKCLFNMITLELTATEELHLLDESENWKSSRWRTAKKINKLFKFTFQRTKGSSFRRNWTGPTTNCIKNGASNTTSGCEVGVYFSFLCFQIEFHLLFPVFPFSFGSSRNLITICPFCENGFLFRWEHFLAFSIFEECRG